MVYIKLGDKSGEILENILEWDGSFDEFENEISERLPNELMRSAKSHHAINKHCYIMKILE